MTSTIRGDIKLAPAILGADSTRLAEAVALAEKGGADAIHIDVMDGHFVPAISFGVPVVRDLRKKTALPLDIHLMVEEPGPLVPLFAKAGANIITVHVEGCRRLYETLELIKDCGAQAGVGINPGTPACAIADEVLEMVDFILIMTVNPGQSRFIPATLKKISAMRAALQSAGREHVHIIADGGLTLRNAASVVEAGASWLVGASAFFGQPVPADEAIHNFRHTAQKGLAAAAGKIAGYA